MYNLQAEMAENLDVYNTFFKTRTSVEYPQKPEVPLVWDSYMDTSGPAEQALSAPQYTQADLEPIAFTVGEFGGETVGESLSPPAAEGQETALSLINDRLKTQARRYPHPITNEMEALN